MAKISIFKRVFEHSKLNFEIYLKFGFCFLMLNGLYRQTQIREHVIIIAFH